MKDEDSIFVARPFLPSIENFMEYVKGIYESKVLTNNGPLVRLLEEELKSYLGVKHLILTSNGTMALQIAYRSLGLRHDVITSPFSFVATASSLVWEGARPIFADIDPKRLTINPDDVRKSITAKTTGIVPVHVFGNPCDVGVIREIADSNDLHVVYDAAHAFGVKYKGKSILNYGDISTLSFHATKLFHTIEGGAIVTSDSETEKLVRSTTNFGITGYDKIDGLGINAKMNEFSAAMGLCILKDIDKILDGYKHRWLNYRDSLEGIVQFPDLNLDTEWNYSYVPIMLRDEKELLRVKHSLEGSRIYSRRYFHPSLDTLQYLQSVDPCSISRDISKRILCLPTYQGLSHESISRIAEIIKAVV